MVEMTMLLLTSEKPNIFIFFLCKENTWLLTVKRNHVLTTFEYSTTKGEKCKKLRIFYKNY